MITAYTDGGSRGNPGPAGYGVVFVSGFDRTSMTVDNPGPFQRPLTETTAAYIVSLLVAALSLYLFDRIDFAGPVMGISKAQCHCPRPAQQQRGNSFRIDQVEHRLRPGFDR